MPFPAKKSRFGNPKASLAPPARHSTAYRPSSCETAMQTMLSSIAKPALFWQGRAKTATCASAFRGPSVDLAETLHGSCRNPAESRRRSSGNSAHGNTWSTYSSHAGNRTTAMLGWQHERICQPHIGTPSMVLLEGGGGCARLARRPAQDPLLANRAAPAPSQGHPA